MRCLFVKPPPRGQPGLAWEAPCPGSPSPSLVAISEQLYNKPPKPAGVLLLELSLVLGPFCPLRPQRGQRLGGSHPDPRVSLGPSPPGSSDSTVGGPLWLGAGQQSRVLPGDPPWVICRVGCAAGWTLLSLGVWTLPAWLLAPYNISRAKAPAAVEPLRGRAVRACPGLLRPGLGLPAQAGRVQA
ncbi:hypothetical protein H8959_018050 [Pygathrix nigripes]